jgi:hypothetical protein
VSLLSPHAFGEYNRDKVIKNAMSLLIVRNQQLQLDLK